MSDIMTREQADEMNTIVKSLRERFEQFGKDSADFKSYQEKLDVDLKKFDEKVEAVVTEAAAERKKADELEERIKHMETLAATSGGSGIITPNQIKYETGLVMNAMLKGRGSWVRFVEDEKNIQVASRIFDTIKQSRYEDMENAEKMSMLMEKYNQKAATNLLRSDIGELGGYLCPPEYSSELARNIIEKSPIRQFCRVRQTGSKTFKQPVRVGIPVATREGEAREGSKSVPNYVMENWSPQRMQYTVPVTVDELLYNNYNLASELLIDNGEAFAVKEGKEFVTGQGGNEGIGFTVDPNVPEYSSATSTLGFNDVIGISGELKQGYKPMYFFNRRTLTYLRLLQDQNDRYLWAGPFGDAATGSPATINGIPYSSSFIDMDDYDVDDGYPVLFADMMMFYMIVDRSDVVIIRDEYTRKSEAVVEYLMRKYCFGKPRIKEAGIRLKKIS